MIKSEVKFTSLFICLFEFLYKNKQEEGKKRKIDKLQKKLVDFGADKRTWTSTELPRLEPESSASANSAISAYGHSRAVSKYYYSQLQGCCQEVFWFYFRFFSTECKFMLYKSKRMCYTGQVLKILYEPCDVCRKKTWASYRRSKALRFSFWEWRLQSDGTLEKPV